MTYRYLGTWYFLSDFQFNGATGILKIISGEYNKSSPRITSALSDFESKLSDASNELKQYSDDQRYEDLVSIMDKAQSYLPKDFRTATKKDVIMMLTRFDALKPELRKVTLPDLLIVSDNIPWAKYSEKIASKGCGSIHFSNYNDALTYLRESSGQNSDWNSAPTKYLFDLDIDLNGFKKVKKFNGKYLHRTIYLSNKEINHLGGSGMVKQLTKSSPTLKKELKNLILS